MPAGKINSALLTLIALLIVGSLINVNTFGPITLSAYFFYTILGSLVAVVVGIGFIKNKQPISIANPLPILALALLACYYILNGLVNTQGGINLRHYIILVDAVLLASYCILLNKGSINLLAVSKIITIITIIESLLCILQYFSIIPSLDTLFKVTGSNVNPNVTAMFLAMATPALLLVFFQGSKTYQIITLISITTSLFALVCLQCRTAFIGVAVSTALIINHQYQLLHKLKSKFSKPILIILAASTLCLTAIAFALLYHSKQASSDGRLFIWKISLQAIANKPLFGSGYGQFEHDYNLAQANYFATKAATQQEIYNASYVHMSYNEYLENLFEGGVIGLVLFVGLLVALLVSPPKKDLTPTPLPKREGQANCYPFAYAGIVSFAIMCFFNFTVQALPVRALFILYVGVGCVATPCPLKGVLGRLQHRLTVITNVSFLNRVPFRLGVFALSLFLFFKLLTVSKAYNQCNTILETSNDLGSNEALQEMAALKGDLNQSTHYLHGYAQLLYRTKHYDAAIEKYNKALDYTSNPDIYMELGNCLAKRAKFTEALQSYTTAASIEPHRFAPKYGLMKIYGFAKDSTNAKGVAQQIVAMNPKVESEKVEFYKKEARKLIEN